MKKLIFTMAFLIFVMGTQLINAQKATWATAPENLVVITMLKDDSSSETKYYYKNGVLQNYIYAYSGASEMEDVKLDTYGNVISYTMPAYEGEDDDVSPFTYY